MNIDVLTGSTSNHVEQYQPNIWLHKEVIEPFNCLKEEAAKAGFCLSVASGFRSFDRQLGIWNEKVKGVRPVLNSQGLLVDVTILDDKALMWAILRWSALPGTSRHHWGTDMDIWDASAVDSNYRLQLEPHEYLPGGPFEPMLNWFENQSITNGTIFFSPYCLDTGGVMPEPWHISYRPVAEQFEQQLTVDRLVSVIEKSDIGLKQCILDNITEIMDRFVLGC